MTDRLAMPCNAHALRRHQWRFRKGNLAEVYSDFGTNYMQRFDLISRNVISNTAQSFTPQALRATCLAPPTAARECRSVYGRRRSDSCRRTRVRV